MKKILANYKVWIGFSVILIVIILTMVYQLIFGNVMSPADFHFEAREGDLREQQYDRRNDFDALDLDSDELLTVDEYYGLSKMFNGLDIDQDGFLTWDEAQFMMTFSEIEGGEFLMGVDEPIKAFFKPAEDSGPEHAVYIDEFSMAKTEITTAQYAMYLNAALEAGEIIVYLGEGGGAQNRFFREFPTFIVEGAPGTDYEEFPFIYLTQASGLSHETNEKSSALISEHPFNQSWLYYHPETNSFHADRGFEDWPVTSLKWWGALAFAEFYELSLPTEAEWEKAAKGGLDYNFPTINGEQSCDLANYGCYNAMGLPFFDGTDTPEKYVGYRLPVGSYEPNPYGLYDMAGNVWEWTLDWYDPDFYQHTVDNGIYRNPLNENGEIPPELFLNNLVTGGPGQDFSHDSKVCRGGSYNYNEPVTRSEYRFPVFQFLANDHFGGRVVLRPSTTVFNGEE